MSSVSNKTYFSKLLCVVVASLLTGAGLLYFGKASGAQLSQRSVIIADKRPGATTTYVLQFTINTPGTLGSIQAQFCSNSPLDEEPCIDPSGFDISGATLSSQSGETGFSISPATTANNLILTRVPGSSSAVQVSYTLDNVVNPSAVESYYARLHTYASADASGTSIDHGGLAFVIHNAVNVTAVVPPYLRICVGGTISGYDCSTATSNYLRLGNLSASHTTSAETQMVLATNAQNGYNVWVTGTTLTSGNDTIPALTSSDISRPGVGQFGINLRANTVPPVGNNVSGPGVGTVNAPYDQPDFFRFKSGELIASAASAADNNKYSVSYIVNIAKDQPAGVYVTTLTYVALGNF